MPRVKEKTRRVALRSTDKPKPAPRDKPVPIIIEVASDGFLQIYGPSHIRPVIFNRLVASRPEEAGVVDEFHELEIPRWGREFYFPKHILKIHNIEPRTVAKETRRRESLAMLRGYQEMAEGDRKKGGRCK